MAFERRYDAAAENVDGGTGGRDGVAENNGAKSGVGVEGGAGGVGTGFGIATAGGGGEGGVMDGMLYVKVMTDEQMEVLRKQISVYATICEQLVEMHKAVTAQQDSIAGMRLGNLYCDPLMTSGGHKITARQRWTPTPLQLQILENIFEQGNVTPNKQKIKDITSELANHGQISETNVYNWFQNRRARSKRKLPVTISNSVESETEVEVESIKEKKAKPEDIHSMENLPIRAHDVPFQSPSLCSDMQSIHLELNKMQGTLPSIETSSSGNLGRILFYDTVLANPSIDQLIRKMEVPGSYNHFQMGDSFDMVE